VREAFLFKFMKKLILLLVAVLLTAGCASFRLDDAQTNLRSSFAMHNYAQTVDLLKKYDRRDVYKSKDDVLYNLEMATATHFDARYDSSEYYYGQAEEEIDALFTKSISRGITSFLFSNDNALSYNGEAYEDVYLNAFNSLNFIHRGDLEGALVEARRMAYKLSRIETKYEGVAKALSKADTLGRGDWKTGKQSVQDSPFSRYLASVLFAKSGKPDDARIEYEKLLESIGQLPAAFAPRINKQELQKIKNGNAYNVLLVGFAGRAPIKYQNDVRLYLDNDDLYLKFSLPALRLYKSRVKSVHAVVGDSSQIPLQLIERMDVVAKEVYSVKEPIIYARTFVRSLAKAIGTNAAGRAVKKENKGLGLLVNILGKVGQEFTEKADTRSWQTMPGQAYVHTLKLPAGRHQIEMEYRDADGQLLYSKEAAVTISADEDLELFESLYWN
jgi:hypothetical protein